MEKIYNVFNKTKQPCIILKRYGADITDTWIEDQENLIKKFTKDDNFKFDYSKAELTGGQMDLKVDGIVCVRVIALNTPLSRLKSMFIKNVRYIFMDEFICNRRLGEKYLNDEPLRVKELYTTYNREAEKPIKIYMFGNPYSLVNPHMADKKIPINRLYPGAFLTGDDWCVWCYQIKPELKEYLLKHNPMYKFDDSYKQYAFDGRAVQDMDIRIIEQQPLKFKLLYVMKLHKKCLGIFFGFNAKDYDEHLLFWVKLLDEKDVSKRRDIVCFDFGDMACSTVLNSNNGKRLYTRLREAIETRYIAYASAEESWIMEEIYQEL